MVTTERVSDATASEVYCLACKDRVSVRDEEIHVLKNNRKQLRGVCGVCGRKVSKFVRG